MTSEDFLKSIDRVKIVCREGILQATHVYTQDGQEIRLCDLKLRIDDGFFIADLTMWRTELDLDEVIVGKKFIRCRYCKQEEDITESKNEDSSIQKSEVLEKL